MATTMLLVIRYELWGFVAGLGVMVIYRLLAGDIQTNGLLAAKPGASCTPERLQLLISTLGGAVYYAYMCYRARTFVPVPDELTALLGGSNIFYVVRKYLAISAG